MNNWSKCINHPLLKSVVKFNIFISNDEKFGPTLVYIIISINLSPIQRTIDFFFFLLHKRYYWVTNSFFFFYVIFGLHLTSYVLLYICSFKWLTPQNLSGSTQKGYTLDFGPKYLRIELRAKNWDQRTHYLK